MCTIIVRHRIDDWCATLIAANRDEFYDRKSTEPRVLVSDPRVVGGRDESKGGTWFGLTTNGLFVGLTNQRTHDFPDESLRSRGELVVGALERGSFDGVRSYLDTVEPRRYNEFNLIFGDGRSLGAAYGRRDASRVEQVELPPGVHVLCNDRLGSPEFPKADLARDRVLAIESAPWNVIAPALTEVLADDSMPELSEIPAPPEDAILDEEVLRRLQAICVKTPVYGTVSATMAAVNPGAVLQYHFSPTPPAPGSFGDYTALTQP